MYQSLEGVDIIRLSGYKGHMETASLIFKALSEEPRLRILNLLLTRGELCVCDIMAALKIPQSTASRHLAYLRKAGLVDDRREAVWIYYSIAKNRNALLQDLLPLLKQHLATSSATIADQRRWYLALSGAEEILERGSVGWSLAHRTPRSSALRRARRGRRRRLSWRRPAERTMR